MPEKIWVGQENVTDFDGKSKHIFACKNRIYRGQTEYTRSDLVPQWNSNMDDAPKSRVFIAKFPDTSIYKCRQAPDGFECFGGSFDGYVSCVEPTAWMPMPLPQPPKEKDDE